MLDHRLLRTQKNEILILVQQAGLDPIEFEWEEQEGADAIAHGNLRFHCHRLVHKPSGYAAVFQGSVLSYSPGSHSSKARERTTNWPEKLTSVHRWLLYLKREIDAPDLWAALSQQEELLSSEPTDAVNTPFTVDEQIQVKTTIEEIRAYITSTYSLSGESLDKVNRKLDYLVDASRRLGRIDWKTIFLGALVGLVLDRLIPSGSGFQQLIGIAGHLLRHVLGSVISPPLIH